MVAGTTASVMTLRRFSDAGALQAALAGDLLAAWRARPEPLFRVALAGGRTPRGLYAELARDAAIDWSSWCLVFGDERMVPPDDPMSNFAMVKDALLDALAARGGALPRVERMRGELAADDAVADYEAIVRGLEPLDVALLGMGDDGHVASLFPGTAEPEPDARVVATTSPLAPFARLSLSARTLTGARALYMIVTGAAKAERLAAVWRELAAIAAGSEPLAPWSPAARIASSAQAVTWYIDEAAAAALPEDAT